MRWLERLANEKTGNLARNISVDQVRELGELFDLTPALSPWRVVVIDTVDDLENVGRQRACSRCSRSRRPTCLFFLVSHAPGRLLPTIRSRCRRLDFQPLDDDAMTSILEAQPAGPQATPERARIIAMSVGSAGRALAFAELDLAKLEEAALAILRAGRPDQRPPVGAGDRSSASKAPAERYAAFLELAAVADRAGGRGARRAHRGERALDAYAKARELAAHRAAPVARSRGDRVPARRNPRFGRRPASLKR